MRRPAARATSPRSASGCSATPSWARRTRTATRRSPTWPGRRRCGRASCRSRAATRPRSPRPRAAYGFERYVTDWRELVGDPDVQLFDNGGPNNLHAEPTIAAAEAGKHVFCEKPLGRDRGRELRDLAARRGGRREAHDRVQLPLRPGCSSRAPDARGGRARRDPPLPRQVSAGVGLDRRRRLAVPQGRGGLGRARRPRRPRDRPRALPRRGDLVGLGFTADVHGGAGGRRRLRGRRRVRGRRSGRSRPRASRRAGRTRSAGRSTAPRARSRSTSSGSTSSSTREGTTGFRTIWSARPTTRSGSGGGRMGT